MLPSSARTTPMPSLHELTALFDDLPEVPLPPPRQRQPPPSSAPNNAALQISQPKDSPRLPFLSRISHWLFPAAVRAQETKEPPQRRPNPFQALKFGKKNVVIAVVDAGTTSFFRFGQGEFAEWPMSLDTRVQR